MAAGNGSGMSRDTELRNTGCIGSRQTNKARESRVLTCSTEQLELYAVMDGVRTTLKGFLVRRVIDQNDVLSKSFCLQVWE